jgi:cytochrome c
MTLSSRWLLLALVVVACDTDAERDQRRFAADLTGGDPGHGSEAIQRYGCGACHDIPGVPGATSLVGPPLTHFGHRAYVAGHFPNTPINVIAWIRHPQQLDPGTAMPEMDVTPEDAADIAAYLYTLQ